MKYSTPVATPVVLSAVFPPLAILAVIARFYARRLKRAELKVDDWMLIPSLMLVLGNLVPMLISACYGNLGKKVPLTPRGTPVVNEEYVVFQKCFMIVSMTMTASLAFVRLTIVLLYYRIFSRGAPWFKPAMWVLIVLNAAWGVCFVFVHLFNCYPVTDTWKLASGAKKRRCITPHTFVHIHVFAISSVVIDILMLALPWPMVLSLRLSGRQKAAILSIFALGGIVLGAAIGKTVTVFKVTRLLLSTGAKQIQYDEAPYLYWTIPETCIALICACLPTLRPVFIKLALLPNIHSLRTRITGTASRPGQYNSTSWAGAASGDKFARLSAHKNHGAADNESVQYLNRTSDGLTREDRDVELANFQQVRIQAKR